MAHRTLARCKLALFHLSASLAIQLLTQAQPASTAGAIYKQAAPSVVSIEGYNQKSEVEWTGTGFIVAADGKLLTNYHVIRNSKKATVRLSNGDAYDTVELLDIDQRKDIALLKIKAVDLQPVRVGNSGALQVGDAVYSLSNALGLDNTLSEGIISGVRQMDGYRLLQITAPISHGSSGGPLFNAKGEVIGITTLSLEEGQSLNFAIPIDYARGMLASPSQPKPLASVYNPVNIAPPPAPAAPTTAASASGTEAKSTTLRPASLVDELRPNVGIFLEKKLQVWTEEDAHQYLGASLNHRPGYDTAHNIISDIFNYADPTALYQHIELNFDAKTKRMIGIFMYPARMSWDDCKKLWGDNANMVRNPDGTQFRAYRNRRVNVFLDKRSNVISIGVY